MRKGTYGKPKSWVIINPGGVDIYRRHAVIRIVQECQTKGFISTREKKKLAKYLKIMLKNRKITLDDFLNQYGISKEILCQN